MQTRSFFLLQGMLVAVASVQSLIVQASIRSNTNRSLQFLSRRCPLGRSSSSSTCLQLRQADEESINGAGSGVGGSQREGKTGWNHSTPKEGSDFWDSGTTESSPSSSSSAKSSSDRDRLRTGWLHNKQTKSPAATAVGTQFSGGASTNTASTTAASGGTASQAQRRLQVAMRQQRRNHRILSPPSFHACGDGRAVVVTEHMIAAPLRRGPEYTGPNDDDKSDRDTLDVYFSVTEKVESAEDRAWFEQLAQRSPLQRAGDYVNRAGMETADGMILYLQGGPGFGAPTPVVGLGLGAKSSWAGVALDTYKRVVLMDQRGTGRSTPITKQTLERRFPDLFLSDDSTDSESNSHEETVEAAVSQTVDYVSQFRADNIVQDAELIREALLVPMETDDVVRPWGASLGQSFGGFCTMTYLSQVKHPPKICLLTGGIAPMLTPTYDVYSTLWETVKERSRQYYDFYPGDIPLIKTIVRELLESPQTLPSGGTLTARRFLQLGLGLGGSPSSFARLHTLFNSAFIQGTAPDDLEFSRAFLKQIDTEQSFDDAPIYFWMHESIYANGPDYSPTEWAAHRAYEDTVARQPEFDYRQTCQSAADDEPVLFFGEMVFPWMAEDYKELSGTGLRKVAEALASKSDWGPLYNAEQMREALDGKCQAAAAVYFDDLYVDFDCAMKVSKRGGPLEKCKVWISNDFQHSGLRDDGANIFSKLHGMATGSIRTPS